MTGSVLRDALGHHVWATLRLMDTCDTLTPDQLNATAPGTYGSILDTMRHVVGADRGYLFRLSGQRVPRIDEEGMSLGELRSVMERNGPEWSTLASEDIDADVDVPGMTGDGVEFHAPKGIRFAEVVHHGTDHRSQICTILTTLGVEPPEIDVWDFGLDTGRAVEGRLPS